MPKYATIERMDRMSDSWTLLRELRAIPPGSARDAAVELFISEHEREITFARQLLSSTHQGDPTPRTVTNWDRLQGA